MTVDIVIRTGFWVYVCLCLCELQCDEAFFFLLIKQCYFISDGERNYFRYTMYIFEKFVFIHCATLKTSKSKKKTQTQIMADCCSNAIRLFTDFSSMTLLWCEHQNIAAFLSIFNFSTLRW